MKGALLVLLLAAPGLLGAAPQAARILPAFEHLVYARTVGERVDRVEVSSSLFESKGESWYEVASHAADQDLALLAAGRPIECWKLQLSVPGIVGAIFGRSSLWYAAEYPHYLVKSEGASGGPGSPGGVLLLESYSSSAGSGPPRD